MQAVAHHASPANLAPGTDFDADRQRAFERCVGY